MRNLKINTLLFLVGSQSAADKKLAQAYEFAGSNRPELEKVLAHYQKRLFKVGGCQVPDTQYAGTWVLYRKTDRGILCGSDTYPAVRQFEEG